MPLVKISLLVFMSEIKSNLTLKKSFFNFFYALKFQYFCFSSTCQVSGQRQNFFLPVLRDASNVFTGFVIGGKQSLQLKNSSILRLSKQI